MSKLTQWKYYWILTKISEKEWKMSWILITVVSDPQHHKRLRKVATVLERYFMWREYFFFFGLRLPASHRRKQFVHGKEACVDDRSTSSRVFPDKFPPEQTNSLLEQGTNKQSRNTASKALKLSAMHRTWVLYLGLEVLVWFVFFLWWWVQFDCFSLKQTPQKRAVYPSTLYLSK